MKLGLVLWLLGSSLAGATELAGISDVSVAPAFFNPSLGQKQTIRFGVGRPGQVTIEVLDRDRFPIRSWEITVSPGPVTVTWDGRDQRSAVVPDEAYNLRLTLRGEGGAETYDPSASFQPKQGSPRIDFFSRDGGILGYTLTEPSRVHVQAGESRPDAKTGALEGPVLKTLVDNSPRIAGPVIEKWNGLDESGTIAVPALPDFVVAVFATSLPPASMIAIGNRKLDFFDYALSHRPADAIRPRDLRSSSFHHHQGLTALEDRTPPLLVEPSGTRDPIDRRWTVRSPVTAKVRVEGKGARYFLAQPAVLTVFVDGRKVRELTQPKNPTTVSFTSSDLPPGPHRIAFNWGSHLGPTAVGVVAVDVAKASGAHKGDR